MYFSQHLPPLLDYKRSICYFFTYVSSNHFNNQPNLAFILVYFVKTLTFKTFLIFSLFLSSQKLAFNKNLQTDIMWYYICVMICNGFYTILTHTLLPDPFKRFSLRIFVYTNLYGFIFPPKSICNILRKLQICGFVSVPAE